VQTRVEHSRLFDALSLSPSDPLTDFPPFLPFLPFFAEALGLVVGDSPALSILLSPEPESMEVVEPEPDPDA
jgi:hypothetical protein